MGDIEKVVSFLKASNVFDAKWYIDEYPDVAASGLEPTLHYVKYGMRVGRPPCSGCKKEKTFPVIPNKSLESKTATKPTLAVLTPNTTLVNNEIITAPASTHIRILQKTYDSTTRKIRYEVTTPQRCLAEIDRYVGLIVQRNALTQYYADAIIFECKKRKLPIIFEIDDDLVERASMPDPHEEYRKSKQSIKHLLKAANLVIVSTDILKIRYSAEATRIIVLPNAINENLWLSPFKNHITADVAWKHKRLFDDEKRIVYMGSKTHLEDLLLLKEPLIQIKKAHKRVRLFTIGITDMVEDWFEPIEVPQHLQDYRKFVPWLRDVFSSMDFAVAPLTDTYFNNAKSSLKFLEYSAAKLSTICSNVLPYNQVVTHRKTGLLVDNNALSWTSAILEAIKYPELITQMGLEAHYEVTNQYLVRDHIQKFDSAILEAISP